MIQESFNGKEPSGSMNLEEVNASSVAILQAAILTGAGPSRLPYLLIRDVVTGLIERNTTVPTNKDQTFNSYPDYQSGAIIQVSRVSLR